MHLVSKSFGPNLDDEWISNVFAKRMNAKQLDSRQIKFHFPTHCALRFRLRKLERMEIYSCFPLSIRFESLSESQHMT